MPHYIFDICFFIDGLSRLLLLKIINPLLDDLNTPLAISSLLKIKCSKTLIKSANLLGLLNRTQEEWLSSNNKSTISENDIELLIQERFIF